MTTYFNDHLDYARDPTNGHYLLRYRVCKQCLHTFDPEPVEPAYPRVQNAETKAEYDQEMVMFQRRHDVWEKDVLDHLQGHPLIKCEHCATVVKKSALKAHQKTFGCTVMRRQRIMEEKGFKNIQEDYSIMSSVVNVLAIKMLHDTAYSNDHFDSEEVRELIHHERDEAKRLLTRLGGIRLAYTRYNKINPNLDADDPAQGWQLVAWAPGDTALALKEVFKKWHRIPWNQTSQNLDVKMEAYYRMWEWLQSDDDTRFAMIGLWELADAPL